MSEEILFDYGQLFDLLELELLPVEEANEDGYDEETLLDFTELAVKEYYNYLFKFDLYNIQDKPEFVAGVKLLRKLLSDLSKDSHSYFGNVWKAMSEIEDDWSMLQISLPLIGHMWD